MSEHEKKAREPSMGIISEAHCQGTIERLARKLLREHTPEQLAIIAVQHIISLEELKKNQAKTKVEPEAPRLGMIRSKRKVIQMTEEELRQTFERLALALHAGFVEQTIKITTLAVNERVKYSSKIANKVRHEANRKRTEKAMAEWDAWKERSATGKKVASRFAKKHCAKYAITEAVMCRWIREHEAKKIAG